jgi:iron complex outermembrane recepter protein
MLTGSEGQSAGQSIGLVSAPSTRPLEPERQSGIEAGVDLFIGRALAFRVTRFDQLASGLIQRVASEIDSSLSDGSGVRRILYAHQNVGEIENGGWEVEGSVTRGSLSVSGTLSLVDSRVRAVAPGYTGDLRPGDRMLGVPARTMGLTATWQRSRSSFSVSGIRAADWVNYDRIALASASVDGPLPTEELGEWLRGFWRTYGGVTRIRAMMSRDVGRGISLVLTGDNLLDRQRGEPDNITILPGRTLTLGMRAEF